MCRHRTVLSIICLTTVIPAGPLAAQPERLEQWALAVVEASSRPVTDAGASEKVLGPPNSACEPNVSDSVANSWRPVEPDAGLEWLTVRYAQPVHGSVVEVYETLHPGAVSAAQIRDEVGAWLTVWEG